MYITRNLAKDQMPKTALEPGFLVMPALTNRESYNLIFRKQVNCAIGKEVNNKSYIDAWVYNLQNQTELN